MAKKSETSARDSAYFLKIVLYTMLGATWLRFGTPIEIGNYDINGAPIGFILGLVLASHDHFKIDRRIEFAILLIMVILTVYAPLGIWI